MNDEFDILEHEIDAMLAPLADRLDEPPSHAAVARVRDAVRHELDEAWLEGQPQPQPSDAALHRVRTAVHAALSDITGGRGTIIPMTTRRSGWSRVAGGLSAAAVAAAVGLCAVIIRLAPSPSSPTAAPAGDTTSLDLFVQASDSVLDDDGFTSTLGGDLSELEERVSTWDSVWPDVDNLMNELNPTPGQSAAPTPRGESVVLNEFAGTRILG